MVKNNLKEEDIKSIINDYVNNNLGLVPISEKYHIGKIKIKKILSENGINIKKRGNQKKDDTDYKVNDYHILKYNVVKGNHYIAVDRNNGYKTNDYMNKGGFLTTHIEKTYNVKIPTLYERRKYYMKTGNYWFEQWFDIILEKDREVKKCPYCDWTTIDINNKGGSFMEHLKNVHGKTIDEYLKEYPNDIEYFSNQYKKIVRNIRLADDGNYITCPICGEKLFRMTLTHILSHNITMSEFRYNYPNFKMESDLMLEKDRESQKLTNISPRKRFTSSKAEDEIASFLDCMNIDYIRCDRSILNGQEIDILIESHKLAIEYDGLRYHCEGTSNKNKDSHLRKTLLAKEKGYKLIHIFEDEYMLNKELVLDKIAHILKLNNKEKIPARKCEISEISIKDAKPFLNAFHLQGFSNATTYLGGFYGDKLIGVMCFKKCGLDMTEEWELSRFATNINFNCQGLASKMFAFFNKKYKPKTVVSFADRRWTTDEKDNLYTKLGFHFLGYTRPSYTYFKIKNAQGEERYKRQHKLAFRKHILVKKYPNLSPNLTEKEMAEQLGYLRIWDCGLLKFVYFNE